MSEEIKIGQSVSYSIANRILRLKPLSLGKMKRATMIFTEKNGDSLDVLGKYLFAILDHAENTGLTLEWVQENITLPEAQEIVDASRRINGLGNFFQTGPATEGPKVERPLEEVTPPTPSV